MPKPERMKELLVEQSEVSLAGPRKNAWNMSADNVSMTNLSTKDSSLMIGEERISSKVKMAASQASPQPWISHHLRDIPVLLLALTVEMQT